MKKESVAILVIIIGKYITFWPELYSSAKKYFLPQHNKTFFVFSDHKKIEYVENEDVELIYQEDYGWPANTLLRYRMFCSISNRIKQYDFCYFLNATILFFKPVGEEVLPGDDNLVFVKRVPPALIKEKRIPYESNPKSTAFVSPGESELYVRGGFNGGKTEYYLEMCEVLNKNIDEDLNNAIIAVWHDESHITRYAIGRNDIKILSPGYLYPDDLVMPYKKEVLIRHKDNVFLRFSTKDGIIGYIKKRIKLCVRNVIYLVLIKTRLLKMEG